ncbi:helix-turn-helix transcriptional regulator [Lutibaculum baratangense]|uniref:Periplasmic molybdate-binding protein n=1 Tax=Lutibaculum baratangense AMV1 TaxID=631454 RepID=V4QZI9_9HYPH|nr:helix-turn-helix transcriptional regulator [Lutibaculum baratangense]ESR25182.1 Periplasmic molybdate-binding protein [Lutibaculum baratangense AMV1]
MDLMTTAEVAAYLRIKERTVYDMAGKRQIPCTRATGKLLFSRRQIDRWVEGLTELPAGQPGSPPPIYAGSSDPLLEWALRESGSGLATLTGGSRDGLTRLGNGEAVVAGVHIREGDGAAYNTATVRRELPWPDVVVIRWAERQQGLLVAPGNPLGLRSLEDIFGKRPRLALRPEGAGSRILFDSLVRESGRDEGELVGSAREALTEGDLAAMITDGEADCGLGVAAAVPRHGVDFVPLGIAEQFDLVMRRRDFFEPPLQKLMWFARTEAFRRRAEGHPGYDTGRLGEVVLNG